MHTTSWKDENGRTWYAHHNGDYSGEVLIEVGDGEVAENQIPIPFGLMKELVGGYMIGKMMEDLEGLDGEEFLDSIGR